MGFNEDFKKLLEEARERCQTDFELSELTGINQGSLSKLFGGKKKSFNQDVIARALDALGARLAGPEESPEQGHNEALATRCRDLEAKVQELQTLLVAKDEIISLQKKLMAAENRDTPQKRAAQSGVPQVSNKHSGIAEGPDQAGRKDRPPAPKVQPGHAGRGDPVG